MYYQEVFLRSFIDKTIYNFKLAYVLSKYFRKFCFRKLTFFDLIVVV